MNYKVKKLMSANIILTSACNSRCVSCDYWKIPSEYLDVKDAFKFFDYISEYGNESIVITGGEPTLHPSFSEIVKVAKKKYGFIVILSTNGSTINNVFDDVKDYIDSYCISFDGKDEIEYKNIRGMDNGFLCQSEDAVYKFVDYFEIMAEKKSPQERRCYVPYNTITLTEKGNIRPCFYLNEELTMASENPINSQFMLSIRDKLDKSSVYREQCNYCCQFNS